MGHYPLGAAVGMPGAAGSAPSKVSDPCPGQDSTQSEGEFGVRDPHVCPSSHAWGVMLKFGFPSPRAGAAPGPSRGIPGMPMASVATGPSCWHFLALAEAESNNTDTERL